MEFTKTFKHHSVTQYHTQLAKRLLENLKELEKFLIENHENYTILTPPNSQLDFTSLYKCGRIGTERERKEEEEFERIIQERLDEKQRIEEEKKQKALIRKQHEEERKKKQQEELKKKQQEDLLKKEEERKKKLQETLKKQESKQEKQKRKNELNEKNKKRKQEATSSTATNTNNTNTTTTSSSSSTNSNSITNNQQVNQQVHDNMSVKQLIYQFGAYYYSLTCINALSPFGNNILNMLPQPFNINFNTGMNKMNSNIDIQPFAYSTGLIWSNIINSQESMDIHNYCVNNYCCIVTMWSPTHCLVLMPIQRLNANYNLNQYLSIITDISDTQKIIFTNNTAGTTYQSTNAPVKTEKTD